MKMLTKQILAASALLLLTAGSASADMISSFTTEGPNEFVARYKLQNFQISTDSVRLRGNGKIESGLVEINEGTNELRLTLNRSTNCAPGMFCTAVMPATTVILLPIRHIGQDACGVLSILAERNIQMVDGGMTRIEVLDTNGSRCGGRSLLTVIKQVKVIVTEQGPRHRDEVMSVLRGTALVQ